MHLNARDPKLTVLLFNECISNHDAEYLSRLMTENHTFIDREGNTTSSKEKMKEAWIKFFEMFPVYKNIFIKLESKDNLVVITGCAFWSDKNPHDSVIWTAEIEDDLVAKWCIYGDTAENRKRFGIA